MKHFYKIQILIIQIGFFFPLFSVAQSNPIEEIGIDSMLNWTAKNMYNEPAQVKLYSEWALEEARKNNNKEAEAKALYFLGYHYAIQYKSDSMDYFFYPSILLSKELNLEKQLYNIYTLQAQIYRSLTRYEKSLERTFIAMELAEKMQSKTRIAFGQAVLCDIYQFMGDYDKAIEYGNKAKVIQLETNLISNFTSTSLALASAYRKNGELEKGMDSVDEAIKIAEKDEAKYEWDLFTLYNMKGILQMEKEKYEEAMLSFKKALSGAIKFEDEINRLAILGNIATVHSHQGNQDLAIPIFLDVLDEMEEDDFNRGETYELLTQAYLKSGNEKKALEYESTHRIFQDSFYNRRIRSLESELAIKYETEKKDETIADQDAMIVQQQKIQWLSWGIGGLMTFLLAGLYFTFQKNKKTNALLVDKNELIEKRNADNELLLKEIHHRVKNNLQTISSLLNLQSASISDPFALEAVQESKNRVQSMALIHQKLYQGEELAAVEMKDYFRTMSETMLDSFGRKAENVHLSIQMEEMELDVDRAIPIGLITNELLTNSLKYAFVENENCMIEISLKKENENQLCLRIADNGKGIPKNANANLGTGFGGRLIQLLTLQLGGKMQQWKEGGVATEIRFAA